MTARLDLGEFSVDVMFKNIKNLHLSVNPPIGRVLISAPERTSLETIRCFVISKLGWIKRQRQKLQEQPRETRRDNVERESHFLWGKRYLLTVTEGDHAPSVAIAHNRLLLSVRPETTEEKRQQIIAEWYRRQLKIALPNYIAAGESAIGVTVNRIYVQRMKTRWRSCNPLARSIRFNTELAKKPKECLEYVVLHELLHLLEATHSARFIAMIDRYMPNWRLRRDQLNQLPVGHDEWE